jgi:capsular exopolysaccharide synthesis family protein
MAGAAATLVQSPVYQAHTSIEIEDLNRDFMNMKQVSPVDDSASTNALTDVQTQLQILQSETLIDRTLEKLGVNSLSALNPQTSRFPLWRPAAKAPTRTQLIEAAGKQLKVTVANQTRLIEVNFQSTDPRIASGFANTLAAQFIDQNMQTRGQLNQSTATWLTAQLTELRNNLQHSDDALQAYARQNSLLYTGDKENVSTEKLRQLQAQLSQAQGDLALKESRFKIASSAAPDTLPDVLNDASLRALRNKITDLKSQEANLATTFKPEYSKSQRTHAEIGTLEAAMERERSEIVTRIANDYMESEQREALLANAYNNQTKLVMQDSQKSIQYDILKREVDSNRQVYEAMLRRVKESSITSALKASNIRIIDPARMPEKPFKPSLPINTIAGLLGGLMLGIVTVVVRERADQKLHQPGDAGRLLGLPELGVVPRSPTRRIAPAAHETNALEIEITSPTDVALADSFRFVLASIIFLQGKDVGGVLVVTSAGPNEGKTTSATNLAIALSKIGRKILLIDGDIRKPSVHAVFGLTNVIGLTDLMNQILLDESAADKALQKTDFETLHVLTSGPSIQTGIDLLFTASMPRLIAHYKLQFDMIIIDSPPLLHMPDARVLGRLADGVVLVTRAGHTLRESAIAACERLQQDQTPVVGVILNDWNPKSSPGGYYGNYNAAALKKQKQSDPR